MIGRSMTAPPRMLSLSSIIPPTSSLCALIHASKNSSRFSKNVISIF